MTVAETQENLYTATVKLTFCVNPELGETEDTEFAKILTILNEDPVVHAILKDRNVGITFEDLEETEEEQTATRLTRQVDRLETLLNAQSAELDAPVTHAAMSALLKRHLANRGINRASFADEINLSKTTIHRVYNGETSVTEDTLRRVHAYVRSYPI